ncbi:MAG: hypothetical protein NWE88_00940 [Candidatus Bathyarchaeota archaeon]|nr:hypothetical protein [Candidatus Bathyarchaeota archaeon]
MALEETIREMIKEELETQLGEQVSSFSSRIDALEKELKERWSLVLSLRKHTLDQLMLEYRNLKEPFQETQDLNAEV